MTDLVEFAREAIKDLSDIARYTAEKWGRDQAFRYAELLDGCFKDIADGQELSKSVLPKYPNVRICRCEHHYIFFMRSQTRVKPVILAVFHERMNLLERLKERI